MKIRLDFVTNSSSSSFIAFSIKSKKMIEALEEIGFQFKLAKDDTITESDTMITPDGEKLIAKYEMHETGLSFHVFNTNETIFEWFLHLFLGYDAFLKSCEDDSIVKNKIKNIEKSIEECDIEGGFVEIDGDSFCMHITVKDGKKTMAVMTDNNLDEERSLGEILLDSDISCADFADKYGEVIVEDL